MTRKFQRNFSWLTGIVVMMTLNVGCGSDDPDLATVDPEAKITTLTMVFTGNNGDVSTAIFRDLDGDGNNDDVIDNIRLNVHATYAVATAFIIESETPPLDVTAEVREESDEHQVFYIPAVGLNVDYTYGDEDEDGNPLGVAGTITTGDVSPVH